MFASLPLTLPSNSTEIADITVKPRLGLMEFDIGMLREHTGFSQRKFAQYYDMPLATLRSWEKGANPRFDYTLKRILMDWLNLCNDPSWVPKIPPSLLPLRILSPLPSADSLFSSELHDPNLEVATIFPMIVSQIMEYKPSDQLPAWAGRKIDGYPKTLAGLEQFQKDNPK